MLWSLVVETTWACMRSAWSVLMGRPGVASDGEPAICMDDHRNRVGHDGLC